MEPQDAHTQLPEIPEQDPAHDIDARKTWAWLLGSAVGVFVTVAILDVVFTAVAHDQRVRSIELAPTRQRDELREQERDALAAGDGRISIDAAIEKYLKQQQK